MGAGCGRQLQRAVDADTLRARENGGGRGGVKDGFLQMHNATPTPCTSRPTFLHTPQLKTATFLQRRPGPDAARGAGGSKSAAARCSRRRLHPALPVALARAVEVMLTEEERGRAGAEQCLYGMGGHGE